MNENKFVSNFVAVLIFISVFLFAIQKLGINIPVTIKTTSYTNELSVVGEGKVEVVPDTVYVDVGITVSNQSTVQLVQNSLTEKNNAIVNALLGVGIKKEDIKTSNFSIYPNYVYESGNNRIEGYNGNVTISIKSSDLTLAPKIIEESLKAGANQVQGTRFAVDNPESYREEAREKAIANAKEQAEKLAKTLGISLGRITNFVESSSGNIPPIMYEKALSGGFGGAAQDSPVIEPGTQTISSVVTVYFEKK